MRVTGGELRGKPLFAPAGLALRPTGDRVRKAIFDLLGPSIRGEAVLDLFAGTGALAIEALSRGYGQALLVENDRRAVGAIKRNLENCRLAERASISMQDVAVFLSRPAPRRFSLVLADPPYRRQWAPLLLERLGAGRWLDEDGWLVLEGEAGSRPEEKAPGLHLEKFRRYGGTALCLYRAD